MTFYNSKKAVENQQYQEGSIVSFNVSIFFIPFVDLVYFYLYYLLKMVVHTPKQSKPVGGIMKLLVLALLLAGPVAQAESALGDITVTDEFQNWVVNNQGNKESALGDITLDPCFQLINFDKPECK